MHSGTLEMFAGLCEAFLWPRRYMHPLGLEAADVRDLFHLLLWPLDALTCTPRTAQAALLSHARSFSIPTDIKTERGQRRQEQKGIPGGGEGQT